MTNVIRKKTLVIKFRRRFRAQGRLCYSDYLLAKTCKE